MTNTAAIFELSGTEMARRIVDCRELAEQIIVEAGAAPETTDDFNQILEDHIQKWVSIRVTEDNRLLYENLRGAVSDAVNARCSEYMFSAYAVGVAVGLRLSGGAR